MADKEEKSDQDKSSTDASNREPPKTGPNPGSPSPGSAAQRLRQNLVAVEKSSSQLKGRGDWVYKENNDLKAQVKELLEKNAELNSEVQSLRGDIDFATTELETVNKALLGLMDPPPLAE
ncbi:hypothetical protein ASPVEDRAFT_205134 [Aspergillus versicolor CBS 583.65]|uniref:Uncharacterized protein n=1 Tax=Aspergillus versicolor CBS 583.65 TaxID=1036611 RepID=A0A1L9P2M2_ASPVE|nr:uncharacterized protein ASPVEDRAFT_205134 [Aspergillus versicolor CBS 583.65]OJI95775.1 hypothetical protein ASPVEDRAFT_205134 [Aspergillus versicolor CBS 583.65]